MGPERVAQATEQGRRQPAQYPRCRGPAQIRMKGDVQQWDRNVELSGPECEVPKDVFGFGAPLHSGPRPAAAFTLWDAYFHPFSGQD